MKSIEFRTIVDDLSQESFEVLKIQLDQYIQFYFLDSNDADRGLVLEKLGDYLSKIEMKNNLKDNDLAYAYSSELLPMLNGKTQKNSQADQYFKRASQINSDIRKGNCENVLSALEDFSKVFLCLYSQCCVEKGHPISLIRFRISEVKLDLVIEGILKEKNQVEDAADKIYKQVNHVIPDPVKNSVNVIQDKAVEFQKAIDRLINKNSEKKEDQPIRYAMNQIDSKIYSKRGFALMMLRLMYVRLADSEMETVQKGTECLNADN